MKVYIVEHHGEIRFTNFRAYPPSWETHNEHWVVNGMRFDHEPSDEEVRRAYEAGE